MGRGIHIAGIVAGLGLTGAGLGAPPVRVLLDMDASRPGIQTRAYTRAGDPFPHVIGVYAVDPEPANSRRMLSLGYIGGIDRGLALGNIPRPQNAGSVAGLAGRAGTPINPGSTFIELLGEGMIVRNFAGPEVQYLEQGASEGAPFPIVPNAHVFTVEVLLDGAAPGDFYRFDLLDAVAANFGGGYGMFSTPGGYLDAGGDAVPDGTQTMQGFDPDTPLPSPPAPFAVDLIAGGDLPAWLVVSCPADYNEDGFVDGIDHDEFNNDFEAGDSRADYNGDGFVDGIDSDHFNNEFESPC